MLRRRRAGAAAALDGEGGELDVVGGDGAAGGGVLLHGRGGPRVRGLVGVGDVVAGEDGVLELLERGVELADAVLEVLEVLEEDPVGLEDVCDLVGRPAVGDELLGVGDVDAVDVRVADLGRRLGRKETIERRGAAASCPPLSLSLSRERELLELTRGGPDRAKNSPRGARAETK